MSFLAHFVAVLVTPTLYASSQDCCQSTKKGIPEIHPYSSESPKSLYFRPIEPHIYFWLDRRQTVSTCEVIGNISTGWTFCAL